MSTQETLLASVQYYRQMDFFTEYQDLTDVELATKISGLIEWEDKNKSSISELVYYWQLLSFDTKRILNLAMDIYYGDGGYFDEYSNFYQGMLEKYAAISRGKFIINNIKEIENLDKNHLFKFKINNITHYFYQPQNDNLFPLTIANQINPLISNTGYQFTILDLSPDIWVVLLSQEEKEKLAQEKDWRFLN